MLRLTNLARWEGHWNTSRSGNTQSGCSLGWPGGELSSHQVWHHHLQAYVSGVFHHLEGCASASNGVLTVPTCFCVPLKSQPLLTYWSVQVWLFPNTSLPLTEISYFLQILCIAHTDFSSKLIWFLDSQAQFLPNKISDGEKLCKMNDFQDGF